MFFLVVSFFYILLVDDLELIIFGPRVCNLFRLGFVFLLEVRTMVLRGGCVIIFGCGYCFLLF